jgi:hypothetical protein
MNHMIHIAAVTQLRLDTEGRGVESAGAGAGELPGTRSAPQVSLASIFHVAVVEYGA